MVRYLARGNCHALADATSATADTISRALFPANVDKGANDTLEMTWNHALLGA